MPALDASGNPLSGAKITFYENGTTTPAVVYADYELTTPLSNPVVANSAGQFASIFANAADLFSVKVETAANVLLVARDDVRAIGSGGDGEGGTSYANILDFGAVGDGETDDTEAFLAARASSPHVYFPGGYHYVLNYTYADSEFSGAALTSGTTISGDGPTSIISPTPDNIYAAIGCDSGDAAEWVENLTIRDLKFLGDVEGTGRSEFTHLLFLSGVKHVLIKRCQFVGAQGDGIILASGAGGPGFERHNYDVTVRDTYFNGVLQGAVGGRNPISVIDCDGFLFDNLTIENWGQDDMPGGIDLEPDQSFSVIKNGTIRKIRSENAGGNRGHITIATDNTVHLQNILIEDVSVYGGEAVVIYTKASGFPASPHNITIRDLKAYDCSHAINKVNGYVWGLHVINPQVFGVSASTGRLSFGDGTGSYQIKDFDFRGGTIRSNAVLCVGISDTVENMTVDGVLFAGATQACVVLGVAGGATSYVKFLNNTFLGTPSNGAVQHDAGTPNALTNEWWNNTTPVGVSQGSFRNARGDFHGSGQYLLAAAAPNAYPYGESLIRVVGDPGWPQGGNGWVRTYRQSAHAGDAVWQEFIPNYTAAAPNARYNRKAIDLSTWGPISTVGETCLFTANITPIAVLTATAPEQEFTVTGVKVGDAISVTPPGNTAGLVLGAARVSAANTVRVVWANVTAGSLTPPAGYYLFAVTRA